MSNLQALTLNSREVAKMLPKRHDHLIRDIAKYSEYLTVPKIGVSEFWQESTYKDATGRALKCYLITKKGCEFIAHKMTGKKGALFTATYINRFHEMEEALKRPNSAVPAPVPRRVTYHGRVLMKATDLAALTGIPDATMLNWAKKYQLPRIVLAGAELRVFKEENNDHSSASRVALYLRESVISLLTLQRIYATLKSVILAYFPSPALADGQRIDLRMAELDSRIRELEHDVAALNGLIRNLTGYSRTKEKHLAYLDVSREFAADLFTNIGRLRMKIAALET